jgi:hypothetical protein
MDDNPIVENNPYNGSIQDKIDLNWILPKLLQIFEDNKIEGDNFTGKIDVYENEIIISNNNDDCCYISFELENDSIIIKINLLVKCSNRKGSGSQTIKNIIQFGSMYGYNYIRLIDMSKLYFDLGKEHSTHIDLLQLKLLTIGTSWYGSLGFKNKYMKEMEPIFKEYIEITFEKLIEKFDEYVDILKIGEVTKKTAKTDFKKNIDAYLNLINDFCNTEFNLNTPIQLCFSNVEKCIFFLYDSYKEYNKDNEDSKITIKNTIKKVSSFIEFILSNIYRIKSKKYTSYSDEYILQGIKSLYYKVELDLSEIQVIGGKKQNKTKTKQNKTKQNKTKQNKTKQNKTKQNKTKQNKNKTKQNKTKTKQNKTKQNKTKQNKTKQNKTKQNKTKQNKTKTKQNKTKQNKTKQNKTKTKTKIDC